MSLDYVYRNSTVSTNVRLFNAAGLPFPGTGPATFTVYDYNGGMITTGAAVQDTLDPAKWIATFSIPSSAPLPTLGEKYSLVWLIKNASEVKSATEFFSVRAEGDPISFEAGRLALKGGSINDSLILDAPATSVHLKVLDESDTAYVDVNVTAPPRQVNENYFYDFTSADITTLLPRASLMPLMAEWTYIDASGVPGMEVHPIYVVSTKCFILIDGVRRLVDKARNDDINPNLRYTEIDLAHFVLEGIQRVNAAPPSMTGYHTENLPFQLQPLAKDAAAVRALQAQYLAEGVSAFDFQGQSVQLNVDRTQYIQSMIDMLNNDLEERIRKAKKLIIRQSGAGVLGVTVSPSTNYAAMLNPRDRMLLLRQKYLNR